jgi:hypothetical protein
MVSGNNNKSSTDTIDKIFEAQESNAKSAHVSTIDTDLMQSLSESKKIIQTQQEIKRRALEQRRLEASEHIQNSQDQDSILYTVVPTNVSVTWHDDAGYLLTCTSGRKKGSEHYIQHLKRGGYTSTYEIGVHKSISDWAKWLCR